MPTLNPDLVELNKRNREFWKTQKVRTQHQLSHPALWETAMEALASEAMRQVPIRNRLSFEQALDDAEATKRRFTKRWAREGGFAPKLDPLQSLIESIVRESTKISCAGLLKKLNDHARGPVIQDIDETHVHFLKNRNSATIRQASSADAMELERMVVSVAAPISGLKHRLTRARKKFARK